VVGISVVEDIDIGHTLEKFLENEHPKTSVTVNRNKFDYTLENGLDGEAVLQLNAFIHHEALRFMHSFPGCSLDLEDLVQEGRLGALKAGKRFEPTRGVQFITYAAFAIRAAMREAIGKGMIHTPRGQKSVPVALLDSQQLNALEAFDQAELAEEIEKRDLLERALFQINKLPVARANLLLRYANGETLAEIAKDMGFSRQRASQILKECTTHIRSEMDRHYLIQNPNIDSHSSEHDLSFLPPKLLTNSTN